MSKDNFNTDNKKTMPVCFSSKNFSLLESYAKKKGMVNTNQALDYLVSKL